MVIKRVIDYDLNTLIDWIRKILGTNRDVRPSARRVGHHRFSSDFFFLNRGYIFYLNLNGRLTPFAHFLSSTLNPQAYFLISDRAAAIR